MKSGIGSSSNFTLLLINVFEDEIYVYESPSRTKWAEKIVQAARELAGNPQVPRKTRSQTSKASFASDSALAEHCYMLISSDPQAYQQACTDPRWKLAMEDELQSLQENNTWELVPLPTKRKVVQCKWVYQTKIYAYVSDIKHKSILVDKFYSQVHGVDYTETFALVAKMD